MSRIALIFIFLIIHQWVQAQYTPVLNEDFNDNSRNWFVGKQKDANAEIRASKLQAIGQFQQGSLAASGPCHIEQ
jgi:hypothetical protein